jgi:MFS transporter, YQGE family, putative transporter
MSLIKDYKKIGFSKGLISLYSGKLVLEFGINIFALFLPIFLYQQLHNINYVILYYIIGSLGYFLLLPITAKIIGNIGIKSSLLFSIVIRAVFFYSFYKFTEDPFFYFILSAAAMILVRSFFWLPFHTESAKLSDKKTRGKQLSLIFSIASFLGVIAPVIGGFILEKSSFAVLAVIGFAFSLLSIIPFSKLPPVKEEYSWSYIETFKYFFHSFNRRMVIAYMSDGAIGVIQGLFWPLFIFTILDEKYSAVGLITGAVLLVGVILRLFIGQLLDKFHKTKMVKIGIALNSTAWILKAAVVSAFHVFLASTYHILALIVLRTSLDTLVYEKAADKGHYVDEYTVIKEMSINIGRVISLLIVAGLLFYLPMQISFILAATVVFFISWLK